MDRFPFSRLFKSFGVCFFKYNMKRKIYQKSSRLFLYGITLTFAIQIFNPFSFYIRTPYILQYFLKTQILSLTTLTILILDSILWVILNFSTMSQIIIKMNDFRKILNQHLSLERKLDRHHISTNHIKIVFKIYIFGSIILMLLNDYINYKIDYIGFFTLLSHYLLFFQFMIGHLYELVFVEKLVVNYRKVQTCISLKRVRAFIDLNLWMKKLTKDTEKIFEINKFVSVISALFGLSFYTFLHYQLIVSGSILNCFTTSFWQFVLSIVLVTCHSWHRVAGEVSSHHFVITTRKKKEN